HLSSIITLPRIYTQNTGKSSTIFCTHPCPCRRSRSKASKFLARLKPFGITFEKSLTDLIKGIRLHSKESPEALSTFLNNAIQECKEELTTTDLEVKATAVLKLAYLEMYGYDMSWCNFHILEVMSSPKFQQKRIGYLAATQSFKN
ncbi:hypothetical protein OXX80_014280, partial [Metschnikowia pulcherrima]